LEKNEKSISYSTLVEIMLLLLLMEEYTEFGDCYDNEDEILYLDDNFNDDIDEYYEYEDEPNTSDPIDPDKELINKVKNELIIMQVDVGKIFVGITKYTENIHVEYKELMDTFKEVISGNEELKTMAKILSQTIESCEFKFSMDFIRENQNNNFGENGDKEKKEKKEEKENKEEKKEKKKKEKKEEKENKEEKKEKKKKENETKETSNKSLATNQFMTLQNEEKNNRKKQKLSELSENPQYFKEQMPDSTLWSRVSAAYYELNFIKNQLDALNTSNPSIDDIDSLRKKFFDAKEKHNYNAMPILKKLELDIFTKIEIKRQEIEIKRQEIIETKRQEIIETKRQEILNPI
jgi:hypothetical protein